MMKSMTFTAYTSEKMHGSEKLVIIILVIYCATSLSTPLNNLTAGASVRGNISQ